MNVFLCVHVGIHACMCVVYFTVVLKPIILFRTCPVEESLTENGDI